MAAVEAPSTRSRIETVDQTAKVLTELAGRLRSGAPMLERAANVYTQQMRAPNGNAWQGDAADSFDAAAQADHLTVVIPVIERAQLLADVSEHGSENLLGAQQMALQAIAEAESDAFTVGEDLSVNDNFLWRSAADQEARQQAAVAYRNYIAHWAARIDAESTRVVAKLRAGAAEMAALTPAHWRQPLTQSLSAGVRNPAAAQPLGASATATALDRTVSVAPGDGKPNQGIQSMGKGGLKESPGTEALSVRNSKDVHRIVDPLPPGKNPGVKTLPTPDEIRRLYEQLTENGKPIPSGTYPGERSLLEDGTEIKYRPTSKWGGPTVEIRYSDGTSVDVHLPERAEKPEPSPVPAPEPRPVPVTPPVHAPAPNPTPSPNPDNPPPSSPGGGGLGMQPSMSKEQEGVLEVIVGIGAALVAGIGAIGEWAFGR